MLGGYSKEISTLGSGFLMKRQNSARRLMFVSVAESRGKRGLQYHAETDCVSVHCCNIALHNNSTP